MISCVFGANLYSSGVGLKRAILWSIVCLSLTSITAIMGCSGGPKGIYQEPKYEGWQFYQFERVKIFHPPNHLHADQFETQCRNYLASIDRISELLARPAPQDTLVVFYYTGYGQGRELTGELYPFVEDSIIHFWLPSYPGPTLVDWLLAKWSPGEMHQALIRHGLRALFDFSGQPYHQVTWKYVIDSTFESLPALAVDTTIDSNTERLQSGEAASLIAYILADFGPETMWRLYNDPRPFLPAATELLGMPPDTIEARWLAFARANVADSIIENYRQKE